MMKYFLFLTILLLISCNSVEKYNRHIEQPVSAKKLKKDVVFVQKKLKKMHPSLDWYISSEELDYKFDSLRNTLISDMKPNEFYLKISPIVASVRQGHMFVQPLTKRYKAKERKKISKKGKGPLSQFDFFWTNNTLYVLENKSQDITITKGVEVVAIDSLKPSELYSKYHKTYSSDGYNTTWIPKRFNRLFSNYVTMEHGIKDSLSYIFKSGDSLFSKVVHRLPKEKKEKDTIAADSLPSVKKMTKEERLANKQRLKELAQKKRMYGFDPVSNRYAKELTYKGIDSTIAVLSIRNFTAGKYKKAYAAIFNELKEKEAQVLVIDLRGNTGGRLNEVHHLYSYLVDEPFQFIDKPHVVSKTSLPVYSFTGVPVVSYIILVPFYPVISTVMLAKTHKAPDGKYYFSMRPAKEAQPQENAFSGSLYVLIDGASFSASCILSSNLKATGRAVFVGEETGGTFNGTVAGRMPLLKMPYSKLRVRVGLMDIRPFHKTSEEGRGILPDIEIIPTLEDRLTGRDPEMEWIVNTVDPEINENAPFPTEMPVQTLRQ